MARAGAAAPAVNNARARVADAGDNGGSVRARSGLGQVETEVGSDGAGGGSGYG